jgi:iron-sulfur cluster assembly accessory protein
MDTDVTNATDQVVSLTAAAIEQVKAMHAGQPDNAGKPLRVYVEGGGCSGLQYGLVFDEKREGDACASFEGVNVVVDEFSANYLRGSIVDFSDNLNSGGFKIRNPNARQSCGCGKSFEA